MPLSAPTPILRSFDAAKAREFYVDFLGFKVDWEHRFGDNFPLYMQVSRGRLHPACLRASRRLLAGLRLAYSGR